MRPVPRPWAPDRGRSAEGPSWDLRTTWLGASAWAGALLGGGLPGVWVGPGAAAVAAVCLAGLLRAGPGRDRLVVASMLVAAVVAGSAAVRVEANRSSPVASWGAERATAEVLLRVRSDPMTRSGRFGDYVVARATTREVTARGRHARVSAPVLVVAGPGWAEVELGSLVRFTGRLGPSPAPRFAAVLTGPGRPEVVREPGAVLHGAEALRASVRRSAGAGPEPAAVLVPALVTGDDQRLPREVVEAFRTSGLTHLTAVSGTNLTLVLAFVLLLARWARVSGRGLLVVGLLGVVGFVLMARPDPSVVRAAAMGTVALLGLGARGRGAGVRALGVAVLVLLAVDPWLATTPGFALSVLATAGILFVAPALREAMARWAPRWLAEAVAIPLAAQLACTPLVAALSGEVSLVAVVANLVVAPAVGPATVLGLAGGVAGLALAPLGALLGWAAAWCAMVIVVVAERSAALPLPAVTWPTSGLGLAALSALVLLVTLLAPRLLRRARPTLAVVAVVALLVGRPLPSVGWPPDGWVTVMCDVGQGDALVVATGPREGIVVDAGPDPVAVDRCLDRLGVTRIPAVVLTHFHADHVDGLPGVLEGRSVGEIQVSPLAEPRAAALAVAGWAAEHAVPVRVPQLGESRRAGEVTWQVLAPARTVPGSPNDSSVVVLAERDGVRLLLTGDVEPPSQAALAREEIGTVDVVKVPHHGSLHQDLDWLQALRPRVALVSVGEGNTYGHPAPEVLAALAAAGAQIRRTDLHGDVAVVLGEHGLSLVSR